MELSDLLNRTNRVLTSSVKTLWNSIEQIWSAVRIKIKSLWGGFRALFDFKNDHPEITEEKRRRTVLQAIKNTLGEDPLSVICDCNISERINLISFLVPKIADALEIPRLHVKIEEKQREIAGGYNFREETILINLKEITRFPMERDEAAELLDTILHEMYHAFQHKAVSCPERSGVTADVVSIWKRNFEHYILPEHNPCLYWNQPVEESARLFAHSVITNF